MANEKIAILGGRGMLGSELAEICNRQGLKITVLDIPEFDITNPQQLKDAVNNSDIIINCAAYTNVDGAESEYDLAYAVNAEAAGHLGILAKEANKYVLHISTDFVFDGSSDRPYVETDEPNPINAYGRTKLAGEQLLSESGCKHCIIRIEWTYGRAGDNFVTKLLEKVKLQRQLKVVDDQIGSPTATTEAAKAICKLLPKRPEGLLHFASKGYVSRFDMAKFILEKKDISLKLTSCKSSDYPSPAKRPLNSQFNCGKIQSLLDEPIERWEKPLEKFLRAVRL